MKILDKQITIFKSIREKENVTQIPLSKAFERIRNQKPEILQTIETLRSGGLTREQYQTAKREKLPGYLFSGIFTAREGSALQEYSGLIVIDLDHLPDPEGEKERIKKDPFTLACFLSPGGEGLKVVIQLPYDPARDPNEQHLKGFLDLDHYFKETYNLEIDKQCKDIARACFDSSDPGIFVNESARVFDRARPVKPALSHSDIIETIQTATTPPETEEKLKALLDKMNLIESLACRDIVKSSPLIYLNEEPYIFKGTINMIQSKEGSHKSRFVNVLLSSMIKTENTNYHFLGFSLNESFSDPPPLIILFDTEQDIKEQVPARLQLIKTVAGYPLERAPENLKVLPLVEFRQEEIIENIRLVVSHFRAQYPGRHLFIVIDIVSDLIKNINDPEKAPELINELNILANKNDSTILTTIHINPNSSKDRGVESKARGHLGTELKNKATLSVEITGVRVKREPEDNPLPIFRVLTLKNRKGKIHPSFRVVFDDSTKLLRIATTEETAKIAEVKSNRDYLQMLFDTFRGATFTLKEDGEKLGKVFEGLTDRYIKDRLDNIAKSGFHKIPGYDIEIRLFIERSKGRNPNKYIILDKDELNEMEIQEAGKK